LRQEIETLLKAHENSFGLLDAPDRALPASDRTISTERPGVAIGPFTLRRRVGEGGMANVWTAEQTQPVRRTVALKIIKSEIETRELTARFEAEWQTLAMMEHPNIAKVLDAGTTARGRPYFAMELVEGVPITQYCEDHKLPVRERLELFLSVCHAVQHAHQKGIIHRDLKPSNVLVAIFDDKPVPKVIDFGVAKATGQKIPKLTMITQCGQLIGTLDYMSPEQASFNVLDIDTRSDIYSLGVLLYELLTGSTPFEKKRLRESAFDEVLRIIRDEEPPRPSTRLKATQHVALSAVERDNEPARLTRLVRGDLDWIVMKCLEKDRSRRYETANGLAMDLKRYLADEPVVARPPSVGYRLGKFVRRNKRPVVAASLSVLALVGGMIGTTWGLIRSTRARALAVHAANQKEAALAVARRSERDARE
jgi:serine/threonine protein kinase